LRRRLRRLTRPARLGTLRRPTPLSDEWGWDRGTPVDRYYIDDFLNANRGDIHGHVLEVKDSTYTERFGSSVVERAVLDIVPTNPQATIVADLTSASSIPDASYDCVILTQTLQYIYDVRAAIAHAHRILKPSGVLLATVPGLGPIVDDGENRYFWNFTQASCEVLFAEAFDEASVDVRGYGNALSAIACLTGMAHEELGVHELDGRDSRFTVLIAIRAVKFGDTVLSSSASVSNVQPTRAFAGT
jgi:SAM-dependent methyltransferase